MPDFLRAIRLVDIPTKSSTKLNLEQQKGWLYDLIDKEKLYLQELFHLECDEKTLENLFLEFCRSEDKLFFETKIEYEDVKKTQQLQDVFYNDYN